VPADMNISITEISKFLRCRRQWHISSSSGMSLKKKGAPQQRYYIGTAFHKACELNASHPERNVTEMMDEWMATERTKLEAEYREQIGTGMSDQELGMLNESGEIVTSLVSQYFEKYGTENPVAPMTYVAPEVSFKIPLLSDRPVYLVGTIDGIGIDEYGGLGVIEHKTYSTGRAKKSADIETDTQVMGYSYALWRLTGIIPTWAMYDGVAKATPSVPKVLKNGKLSVDKRISTTYKVFMEAVLANGEDPDDPRFEEIIERLAWQDQSGSDPFFTRHVVSVKQKALAMFEKNLMSQARDMWVARDDEEKRYPNFPWQGCGGDCDFQDVCRSMQFGEDVDSVVASGYTKGTYGTMEGLRDLPPQTVTDVASLKAAIATKRKG
jgi:PD-(D/E)XK nuclease superfamily protein